MSPEVADRPVSLLLSAVAADRLEARLAQFAPALRLLRLERGGGVVAQGGGGESKVPDIAWLSMDIFTTGQFERFKEILETGGQVRWLHTVHAGLDAPIYSAHLARGARLSNSHVHAPAIAEFVLGHVLSEFQLHELRLRAQREHRWSPGGFREIAASKWLVIGCGQVGGAIARRVRDLGASVAGVGRRERVDDVFGLVHSNAELTLLLPQADVVVLSCPLNEETRDLVNDRFIRSLKHDSILVNVARGAVLNEQALLDGLRVRKPGRAILDVTRYEPLPIDSPLWTHPQVRLTAHSAYAGSGTAGRDDQLFLDNLRRYLAGAELQNEVRSIH
jgi:phosphoglycerate dehydrogenase-like enzyme